MAPAESFATYLATVAPPGSAADHDDLWLSLCDGGEGQRAGRGQRAGAADELSAAGHNDGHQSSLDVRLHLARGRFKASKIGRQRSNFFFGQLPRDGLHHRIGAFLGPVLLHDRNEAFLRPAHDRRNTVEPAAGLMTSNTFRGQIFTERLVPGGLNILRRGRRRAAPPRQGQNAALPIAVYSGFGLAVVRRDVDRPRPPGDLRSAW